jgi:hypothetical protein
VLGGLGGGWLVAGILGWISRRLGTGGDKENEKQRRDDGTHGSSG